MFQIDKAVAKIANFNPRCERHGDDTVPAGDIKITLRVHSAALDAFDPALRKFLFRKPNLEGEQVPLIEGDTLTALARPNLKPLQLTDEFGGYKLTISQGLEASDGLHFDDVTIKGFKFTAINGGAVEIDFSAAVHESDQFGDLCNLIQNVVDVTLTPPEASKKLV